jgi:hypothetical protein
VRAVFLCAGVAAAMRAAEVHVDLVWGCMECAGWVLFCLRNVACLIRCGWAKKRVQGMGVPMRVSHSAARNLVLLLLRVVIPFQLWGRYVCERESCS